MENAKEFMNSTLEENMETQLKNDGKEVLKARFIELANKREEIISQLKEINLNLEPVLLGLGEGLMLQSSEGLVYKIQKPKGQYVVYKEFEYVRTKRADEKKGSLSKKEAQDNGFVL